ncbi:uncharacterized protein FOMMEDRAFT_132741 [Fomitiporia mediterranea MF3/22]|uniref:uncharacterized protein n=1 Tax=Fomitiporia mediterranea (strain MF3/22) TaxID=694068 RepID=UPI0004409660|nr:uncharacterized protein FOMMEDRAFT_132741 [Fomitiporia mediterranea MF3/22]EJD04899.1 hypothetical protein FOMMEDRAFT_132741 [Fomitiporia mediterranea MF3/22]
MSTDHFVPVNTVFITILRASFCYTCYTRVLRSVFHDLQTLTGAPSKSYNEHDVGNDDSDAELELDTLPAPNTARDGPLLSTSRTTSHSNIARLCFSLCFSESCTLFLLFMSQELNLLDSRSRMFNWRISLFLESAMILLVIPLSQNFLLTYQSPIGHLSRRRSIPARILMALIPYSLFLFTLSMIPLPESLAVGHPGIISAALPRLIVLGTFIIGMLSGLGAARAVWDFMPVFSQTRQKVPTEQQIQTAEESLERIRNDIQVRRREERRLQGVKTTENSSWMSRVASKLTSIQREITGLLALEYQMDRNLENIRRLQTNARYNKTLQGRVFLWAGRLFALYCVFRTLSCVLNILAPLRSESAATTTGEDAKSSYPDLITHFLTYLVSLLPFVHLSLEQISAISRQVSLALVGVIILSSVRSVLRAVSRVLKITSQNLGASLLLLILAQLMGTYLISTLVQLRTAFPPKIADMDSNVFSTLPAYEVFGAAFDYSYLLSALATGVYLWIDERINGTGKLGNCDS